MYILHDDIREVGETPCIFCMMTLGRWGRHRVYSA